MRQVDIFDDYLAGNLGEEEKIRFESELAANETLKRAFEEHQRLIETLNKLAKRKELASRLKSIHREGFGEDGKIIAMNSGKTFAYRHGRTIAVAASTALIAVLITVAMLSTGGYMLTRQSNQMEQLSRELQGIKATTNGIVEGITQSRKPQVVYAPANIAGSAFALNNNGFVITSYHMIKDADSVFLQNNTTKRALAHLIVGDPRLDIAILKIDSAGLAKNWQVPFTIKDKPAEIGEKVFTLGYPREEMVYGEGSLSSLSGYTNDSAMYQISIPVNPGNSGGPLLDENGNIIGVVRGKVHGAEATGFAVKASEILHVINSLPDSTRAELVFKSNKRNNLRNIKRTEQVKKINPYVFNVLVYK